MGTTKTQISSELQSVGEIIKTDYRYLVPAYQRNFSWTKDEVEQLWNDVNDSMEENRSEYFLGTIVVTEERDLKERIIIDGQQRLACLIMMFSVIRTIYQENKDDRALEVFADFLGVRDRKSRIVEPRLTLNALNEPVFQKLVIDDPNPATKKFNDESKRGSGSNRLLCEAIDFISEAIKIRAGESTRYESYLLKLEDFIRDHVVIILVKVQNEADAYLVFETLNDRGLELSISDLLKNYIFGKALSRLNLVKKQWDEMVLILGGQNETQFLRHYWLSKYGVVRERDLYKEIKNKFENQSAVLSLMEELREAADNYAATYSDDHNRWKGAPSETRKELATLQLLNVSQFRPMLLAAFATMESAETFKLVHVALVLSMRYSIIGSLGTGNIERAYSNAALAIRQKKADTAAKVFNQLKSIYSDDTKFENDFSLKEITKPKVSRYILAALTNSHDKTKVSAIVDDEKLVTLEHIMPKTRTQDWQKAAQDESEYFEYVNRLGNMTLIERDKNKGAGGLSFDKKKSMAYSKSAIIITKKLCDYKDWTIADIKDRQKALAKSAVQVWSIKY